jgi:hypothetical protein
MFILWKSPLEVKRSFEGTIAVILTVEKAEHDNSVKAGGDTLVSCSVYSTMKVETICSFETSVEFQPDYTALFPRR